MDRRRSAPFAVLVACLVVLVARPAAAAGPTNDPESAKQWGLVDVKAPEAWANGRGAGVSIAVVSTGIRKHADLTTKLDAGFDAGGGDAAVDTSGRGTHLAGIAAAATDNGIGIAGVAPEARLLPYKAFNGDTTDGSGHISALIRARTAKPTVVLVDVPDTYPAAKRDLLRQALKVLGDDGTSVVVGAQDGLALDELPVLAVAASTRSGAQAPGTAGVGVRGVAAPGLDILSIDRVPLLPTDSEYKVRTGTSQAAAHVAGALAILRGLGASATQAADLLRTTARPSGSSALGSGIIDVAAAAVAYKAAPPPTPVTSTTSTTIKASTKPGGIVPGKATAVPTIPPGRVAAPPIDGAILSGEPVEPGQGEAAVTPPGAEAFADNPGSGASIFTGGQERPWGTLAVGFGFLFGVGSALSITFRRLAQGSL